MMHTACCLEEVPYCYSSNLTQIGCFQTVTSVWIHQWQRNDAQSLKHIRCVLLFFKVIRQISRSHGFKNHQIRPKLGVSGLSLQFEFRNGYGMMHRAWSNIEEVSYCFSMSYVKFRCHTAKKIVDFDPNWAFPDCNSSLNSQMATKWCTNLEVAQKWCPVVFRCHTSNCKVTRWKHRRFWLELSVSGLQVQFEFTDGFEMMHKAWRSIEEVSYWFFSVIYQISRLHGQEIDDLIPIPISSKITRPVAAIKSLRSALL